MSIDKMKKVHSIQLEMVLEIKRICEKHNIKYSIIAGTLLGAVRHKGFIPWDDDLDVGMLRDEYEKFTSVCKFELSDKFFLQTLDSDSGFGLTSAKLRKNGTKFIERNSSKSNLHNGIYIDIFPFDNIPNSTFKQKYQNIITYILKRILLIKQNYELWEDNEQVKKVIYKFIKFISKPISINMIKRRLYKEITRYNYNNSDLIVAFGGAYGYWKEMINKDWLTDLDNIMFEGYLLSCPRKYTDYLSYFYGDYMTPPPESKRYNRHNIIEIEF